jgi:hypothetical protein
MCASLLKYTTHSRLVPPPSSLGYSSRAPHSGTSCVSLRLPPPLDALVQYRLFDPRKGSARHSTGISRRALTTMQTSTSTAKGRTEVRRRLQRATRGHRVGRSAAAGEALWRCNNKKLKNKI